MFIICSDLFSKFLRTWYGTVRFFLQNKKCMYVRIRAYNPLYLNDRKKEDYFYYFVGEGLRKHFKTFHTIEIILDELEILNLIPENIIMSNLLKRIISNIKYFKGFSKVFEIPSRTDV